MADEGPKAFPGSGGDGPWWARLGAVGIAMAGIVYLGESLGGRFLDILAEDLAAERQTQRELAASLDETARAQTEANELHEERAEIAREQNRLLERILDELHEQRRQKSTE